jgi:hypothetical protein
MENVHDLTFTAGELVVGLGFRHGRERCWRETDAIVECGRREAVLIFQHNRGFVKVGARMRVC